MNFITANEVIFFLENSNSGEARPSGRSVRECRLERMKILMNILGNPQNYYKKLHVAGSKGKGSTSSFLASAIHALGYRTGLYMSPHVSDCRERFTIDGKFADDNLIIEAGNTLKSKLENFEFSEELGETYPTTFELYTAFAFVLFKTAGCSWAVIETGLGGRLDATNIILPEASVLTPIELEHTELLGNTITEIAGEKAKIIKQNIPSFISFQAQEAKDVFEHEAKLQNSELIGLSDTTKSITTYPTESYQYSKIEFNDGFTAELRLKMLGDVQAYNCALALTVLRKLGLYKKGVTEAALENNTIPGRMEKLPWKRPLFIDGAHTEKSVDYLIQSFRKIYHGKEGICIFGCLSGKNAQAMGKIILDNFNKIVVCKPGSFKKSNPGELYDLLMTMKNEYHKIVLLEDPESALEYCLENTEENEPVLSCGSFYLAGEIKDTLCL